MRFQQEHGNVLIWRAACAEYHLLSRFVDIIAANPGHVIGSTACLGGALPTQLMKYKETKDETLYQKILLWCNQMVKIFGEENFFLELQPSEK